MPQISLKYIKLENAKAVLKAIAAKQHITKAEIADATGLSLMTVGKITDMLGAGGIVLHGKNVNQTVGRRAEVLRIRHDWLIPVFDLSGKTFRFSVTDLEGNIADTVTYTCTEEPQYIGNEFVRFLENTLELLKKKYKNQPALGIGIAVPGYYDQQADRVYSTMLPEFSSLKLMQNIRKIFKQSNVVIDNASRLCAAGIIENLPNYKNQAIACLTVNDSIECTACEKGIYLHGAGNLAGRFGDLPYASGVTYANFLRDAESTSAVFEPVLNLLKAVCVAYDPQSIYLSSEKFLFTPHEIKILESSLHNLLPWVDKKPELHFAPSTGLEAMGAIISKIIENWLDNLVTPNT